MASDVSAPRDLELASSPEGCCGRAEPLAVGIVNVTADSMYEGARSVTPERAIGDGRRLADAGLRHARRWRGGGAQRAAGAGQRMRRQR